jgi:glycosyltransferase involved in cell wall biosynthesis
VRRAARRIQTEGFAANVIDAHYFYPDGVAAALLARELGLPLVITGRGSDLTLLPRNSVVRRQIVWAARSASALVTVSDSLKRCLCDLGVEASKIAVLRNGVETDLFLPMARDEARKRVGAKTFTLLCVGGLIPRKGVDIAIDAMPALPDCELLIAGAGPLRARLEQQVDQLGVRSRVHFLGEVAHRELPALYNAADAMLLMSDREGWANVILESLACGTPVIATDVGGAGEIIRSPVAGRLLRERNATALVREIESIRTALPDRALTRQYAEGFGWKPVAAANRALLEAVSQRRKIADIAGTFSVLGPSA